MTRLVCVGDSFTEGMCDDLRPDGQYLGWADRVAEALAVDVDSEHGVVEYSNLAVRGKLLDQVVAQQLPPAALLEPTILTFHAGPNDVLRRGTDLGDLFDRYARAVQCAREASDRVVLFTSIGRAGGSGRLAQLLADRFAMFNDNVRRVAGDVDATVVDVGAAPALTDRRMWHTDRLHLNAEGHRRVAAAVLEELGVVEPDVLGGSVGWWREPLPAAAPTSRREDLLADAAWVREHLAPWVLRRLQGTSSGDGRAAKDPTLRRLDGSVRP